MHTSLSPTYLLTQTHAHRTLALGFLLHLLGNGPNIQPVRITGKRGILLGASPSNPATTLFQVTPISHRAYRHSLWTALHLPKPFLTRSCLLSTLYREQSFKNACQILSRLSFKPFNSCPFSVTQRPKSRRGQKKSSSLNSDIHLEHSSPKFSPTLSQLSILAFPFLAPSFLPHGLFLGSSHSLEWPFSFQLNHYCFLQPCFLSPRAHWPSSALLVSHAPWHLLWLYYL